MSVRAISLNCVQCGSPISLKNGLKTKTVVCPACNSVLGKQGAQFKVLQEQDKRVSMRASLLCVGLQGTWKDKRCEIIGCVRYYEEGDTWDEWLVLGEDGRTFWIEEESGRYTLHQVFLPEVCPEISALRSAGSFVLGPKENVRSYRVTERGVGQIKYIVGELTWRAKLNDKVAYLSAKSPKIAPVSIEYTDSEIEFFRSERLNIDTLYRMFNMKEHFEIVADMRKRRARSSRLTGQWFVALTIFGIFASMLMCMNAMFAGETRAKYLELGPISAETLPTLNKTITLNKSTAEIRMTASVTLIPPVDSVSLFMKSPSGKDTHLANFHITEPGWNRAYRALAFTVPESGEYHFSVEASFNGKPRAPAPPGLKLAEPSSKESSMTIRIYERLYASGYWLSGAFFMVILGVLHAVLGMTFISIYRKKLRVPVGTIAAATARLHERVHSTEASG